MEILYKQTHQLRLARADIKAPGVDVRVIIKDITTPDDDPVFLVGLLGQVAGDYVRYSERWRSMPESTWAGQFFRGADLLGVVNEIIFQATGRTSMIRTST